VLWAFVHREEPWRTGFKNRFAIMQHVLDGGRPEMQSDEAGVSPVLRSLIESCWHQDADQRPKFGGKSGIVAILSGMESLQ
jgi:hypothetical protein